LHQLGRRFRHAGRLKSPDPRRAGARWLLSAFRQLAFAQPAERAISTQICPMKKSSLRAAAAFGCLAALIPAAAWAEEPEQNETIVVTGRREAAQETRPNSTASVDAETLQTTTNVINTEDALRYLPSLLVRKRHVGDTQAPVATRTSGVGASARSLIYADGVLLSALIGNNNTNASPKWAMLNPESIDSVEVLYGPFSAAYPGNSIGAVVEFTTRMPDHFEATLDALGSLQNFSEYGTHDDYGAHQFGATIGNRFGPFAFWIAAEQTTSDSQPLTFTTLTQPASPSGAGTPLTGAFGTTNRTGPPIVVTGAGGFEHQVQDNISLHASYDLTSDTTLTLGLGRFGNDTDSHAQSYLRDTSGATVYAGGPFNINGYQYTIGASSFSNGVYTLDETQWMESLTLNHRGAVVDWRIVASNYDVDKSEQRIPSAALPAGFSGGAGSITDGDGTGWRTLDGKVVWRATLDHELSFGAHGDQYELQNNRYNTTNWISGDSGALASASRGKTQTLALWAQDVWRINPALSLTTGLRWEYWRAHDGFNFSLSPVLSVNQPEIASTHLSPKASLTWQFASDWSARASIGQAYRFPTVGELYQAITVGALQTSPNPNLKPEDALSTEWSLIHRNPGGDVRLTFFTEDIKDALISQTATIDPSSTTPPLPPGTVASVSFIQNVDKVESRGVELAFDQENVLIDGLTLSGSVTYVHSETARDAAFPAAVGKQTPQVPDWRATLVATYRPDDHWAFTLAGRYADRMYANLDNSDTVSHTYQGFETYIVLDARIAYQFNAHWTAAVGIENFNNDDYFLFHPFPQRTYTAELRYRF
jgi:iron complex outermembrane receptor protein